MSLDLSYLNVISREKILTFEDILRDKRLTNQLWIELLLNPGLVRICELHMADSIIRDALVQSLSWYLGFKWLLPNNKALEELYEKRVVKPYQIRGEIYRQDRRSFLKGILHARLC